MKPAAAIIALFLATTSISSAVAAATPAEQLTTLTESMWQWQQGEFAQQKREGRWQDGDRLPDVTPAAWERRRARWEADLKALDAIDQRGFTSEQRINAAIFRELLLQNIQDVKWKTYEAPLNSDTFFWGGLSRQDGYTSAADARLALKRMADTPRYFAENIANMRAGIKRGYTVPQVTLNGRLDTIVPYTDPGPKNPLRAAFEKMSPDIAGRDAIVAEADRLITTQMVPAYAQLLDFMRKEYVPNATKSVSARDLPGGLAFYQDRIRYHTTLDLTADEIHAIGLKEVARIDADMQKTMADAGFKGTFPEFLAFLRSDPRFYAKTPEELLHYVAWINKKMDGKLKDVLGLLPRYRYTIKPVPDSIAPIYTSGRGGLEACWFNTYDLPQRPLYNLTSLALHECNPGHSLQAALALEGPDRPDFRRETYFSGYGEGWALYTEWLGTKIGMYETPYDEFGRETFEMWRAARLVIDTGIHAKGWSRQQAIDYLKAHTALAQRDIENEVDRYISWPGQALAYKLGEMRIRALRARAEKELGPKFDQRPFHDYLLAMGSVPLPVLDSEMNRWIDEQKAKPAEQ